MRFTSYNVEEEVVREDKNRKGQNREDQDRVTQNREPNRGRPKPGKQIKREDLEPSKSTNFLAGLLLLFRIIICSGQQYHLSRNSSSNLYFVYL